jgi:hypothetical protein
VLVVDPNPGGGGAKHTIANAPRPDLMSTLLKVVTLPRAQTIGGEIDRIKALSGPLATRENIYNAVEAALTGSAGPVDSPARAGYLALRTGDTIADLAAALARVGFGDRAYEVDSAPYELARTVVTAWLDGASAATRSGFLGRLDLAYFLRRVNYVNHRGGVPRAALAQMADVRQRLIRLGRALRSATRRRRACRVAHRAGRARGCRCERDRSHGPEVRGRGPGGRARDAGVRRRARP